MDDLIAFLRARLDEDEAVARAAGAESWSAMTEETPDGENIYYTVETRKPPRAVVESLATGPSAEARIDHMGRHDPARVLAEVDAKRRIAKLYEDHERLDRETFEVEGQHARSLSSLRAAYWDACRHLALPYADHPDYRQEWTP
ncbi:DUF6221 family protein [Streptomyces sp. MP131-18]|uniref:DUF6221 family protein n=1 Tax=Streptomyces sp. MP131-18 TaxID=1857892 RepID=UPI00097C9CD8|nr:DUF6221 family protein [Streptomyces sp. MP131-18]ONK09453.1 hypothetical protein STBA_01530 [Streptomyces sp. MP131-18]